MKPTTCQTRWKRHVVWAILLALSVGIPQALAAAEEVTGDWEITMDFGGRPSFATLSLAKKADGTLTGTWGRAELSNVKFDGQKLTFVRTMRFGDQEFAMNYAGTLKDGKLTGNFSTDQGEFAANGARKKPKSPALGQWDLEYTVGGMDVTAKLTITQKADGTLDGKWTTGLGESVISTLMFQDGKLTLSRKSTYGGNSFDTTFEGTIKDDKLTGTSKSDMGDVAVTGSRAGAALIGRWDLTINAEQGTFPGFLEVEPDLSARYEFLGGMIPVKDLKFEANQVSFKVPISFGNQDSEIETKAKVDGETLKGQQVSQWGTAEVTGRKIEAAASAPAASAAAKGSGLVGTTGLTSDGNAQGPGQGKGG